MDLEETSTLVEEVIKRPIFIDRKIKRRHSYCGGVTRRIRKGSITSSIVSRKSSSRSIGSNRSKGTNRSYLTNRSNVTITSNSSFIKKNSGNFDGGNSRSRRKSSTLQRKASTSSRKEQMIAEFYRDLEELEEISSSDSSDDEEGGGPKKLKKGKINVEEVESHKRVEEYLMNLQEPDPNSFEEDEGIISDTTNKSDMSEGKFDNSYNSNHSTDISMNSTGTDKHRRYIKRPTPPENIIKNLESSPMTQRQKHRSERSSDDNGVFVDVNRNKLHKSRSTPNPSREVKSLNKSQRHNSQKEGQECRGVPSKKDLFIDTASESSCSTDSAHGSTRSISTVSSVSVFQQHQKQIHRHHHHQHHAGVPKNFIPGHTKPVVTQRKSLPPNYMNVKPRKVSFCLRGIPFRVYNNSPRTFRALAHAGCIGLVVPAPENHKCKH